MAVMSYIAGGDYFHMVYLDEGLEDPPVYEVLLRTDDGPLTSPQINKFRSSLSENINNNIYHSKMRDGQL